MSILIEGINYEINNNEFTKIYHTEYNSLKLYNDISLFERIIGLIKRLTKCFNETNFVSYNTTHGGFIPLNLINVFDKVYIYSKETSSSINIYNNIYNNISNNVKEYNNIYLDDYYFEFGECCIALNIENEHLDNFNVKECIFITEYELDNNYLKKYQLKDSNYILYIGYNIIYIIEKVFKHYLVEDNILNFDNLINLCIMVKNAGPQFEKMLTENIDLIDKWTILDTGSTDDTIDIINRVLIGKKEGKLYQEPFLNFMDSRNRLLKLAGNDCKYILMLDDTYIVKGDLRNFLNEIRSDQYANSLTLFIHSDDTKYGSNRIIKSNSGLKYIHKIHEVISDKDNINIVIPENRAYIFDERFDYMEKRTMERKKLDLKLLYEEINDNPNDPRAYYYLGQTYNLLEDYEKAFYFFMKRCEFKNSGFIQERVDASFEAARIANFKLNRPWNECEQLYMDTFKIDESRPESLYFIGIHYYLANEMKIAYNYFKQAYEIGFPLHCQYSLKPTLSFHFLPKFLSKICYILNDYELGLKASKLFLQHNNSDNEDYQEIVSWYKIYEKLNIYSGSQNPKIPEKPILCFVADGGFNSWSGSNILTTGVGGSETYVIEMARYIKQNDFFGEVIVFCNTLGEKDENFEGVNYKHLSKYYEFINNNYIHTCIISRFSEYLPVTFEGFTENVYLVVHDLTPSGIVIPMNKKLKNIFCLTEWHVNYLSNIFPTLKNIIVPFYYGIDNTINGFQDIGEFVDINEYKEKYKFIYSSYPNRGLLELLQMWPEIHKFESKATLHIYCDVENKWSNETEPEKMSKIKALLYLYLERNMGIYYYGWVSKKELADAWRTSQFWLYPCTFMETFCLTALEAAKSKTLAITNNLAALQNTVGDRGIIIEGDPTTQKWQDKALNHIKDLLQCDEYDCYYKKHLKNNYNWASNLSWRNQANKLLTEYILKNTIEYKGMYNWTNDLPEGSREIFMKVIEYFKTNHIDKEIKVLEIGTYTGTSLINIIKLIPNSLGYGLDKWESYRENNLLSKMDNLQVEQSFYNNILSEGLTNRIFGIKSSSTEKLIEFIQNNTKFDLIYVDGSHVLLDCYTDLVLSWSILEKSGILVIDDYLYKKDENILDSPFEAVNHFLKVFEEKYKLLDIGYRVFLEKLY